jgi:hypothetical protein
MNNENFSFWFLLVLCTAASWIPVYPPIPLVWLCASLIWYQRYGPSWYTHDLNTDEDHFYIFDLIICLPLVLTMAFSIIVENIWRKQR